MFSDAKAYFVVCLLDDSLPLVKFNLEQAEFSTESIRKKLTFAQYLFAKVVFCE